MTRALIYGDDIHDWDSFYEIFRIVIGFDDDAPRTKESWLESMKELRTEPTIERFTLKPEDAFIIVLFRSESFKQRLPEIYNFFLSSITELNMKHYNNWNSIAIIFR